MRAGREALRPESLRGRGVVAGRPTLSAAEAPWPTAQLAATPELNSLVGFPHGAEIEVGNDFGGAHGVSAGWGRMGFPR